MSRQQQLQKLQPQAAATAAAESSKSSPFESDSSYGDDIEGNTDYEDNYLDSLDDNQAKHHITTTTTTTKQKKTPIVFSSSNWTKIATRELQA